MVGDERLLTVRLNYILRLRMLLYKMKLTQKSKNAGFFIQILSFIAKHCLIWRTIKGSMYFDTDLE